MTKRDTWKGIPMGCATAVMTMRDDDKQEWMMHGYDLKMKDYFEHGIYRKMSFKKWSALPKEKQKAMMERAEKTWKSIVW